ncbi:hypothetical protein GCM10007876_26050 [Litoribrevibacter albus]|uniref:Uncharacterized protein n=1 Tax=Litoribrevibacter albus TaxID=1473156 RepID=A0AA37W909_9GAMM|nr:hypothetical protein GCM10007876_26050 [Litoribrevibacter albus]
MVYVMVLTVPGATVVGENATLNVGVPAKALTLLKHIASDNSGSKKRSSTLFIQTFTLQFHLKVKFYLQSGIL